MRKSLALAAVSALALAGCGSDREEADDDINAAAESSIESGATPADASDAAITPGASASATPASTPTVAVTQPASFSTCAVCHTTHPGRNGIGPSLAGVVGRRAGSVPGANYSPAMEAANLVWNERNLDRYLADPMAVVPGGAMPPPGLDPAQRRAVINYLKTL